MQITKQLKPRHLTVFDLILFVVHNICKGLNEKISRRSKM